METVILATRNRHKWRGNECIVCGCVKVETENPNQKWNWVSYADPETGEIKRSVECKTKQILLWK